MQMLSKLDMIKNVAERAFVQAWLDMPDRGEEQTVALAKDVFDIDDSKKAHTRAMTILGRPKVQYAVRLTIERKAMETPARLGKATDTAIDFLEDTVVQASDDDEKWPEEKAQRRNIGVNAAKSLLSGYAKVSDGGGSEKSVLELLKSHLPDEAKGLVDMEPAELIAITETKEGGDE